MRPDLIHRRDHLTSRWPEAAGEIMKNPPEHRLGASPARERSWKLPL